MDWELWAAGLAVAVIGGAIACPLFLYLVRRLIKLESARVPGSVPGWITGAIERFVFCILVGLDVSGVSVAMMLWLALKLAANWMYEGKDPNPNARACAFTALLAGLISMLFATLGGYVASGDLWSDFLLGISGVPI